MAPFEALYGRRCRSPVGWFEVGETKLLEPDLVQDAIEKVRLIKKHLLAAQSRQKAYADHRRRNLEFSVGDQVFLRVSPMKGVMRFGKKGTVAYRLALPPDLAMIHPVFHVSMLCKYLHDPSHVLTPQSVKLKEDLSFEEELIAIIDRQVRKLHSKEVASVKVVWKNHSEKEVT
ncbi:uncharacterized protein LOC107610688 [Arachis ipaensis]|uniref:uncharacterized protein LOC107610688 n=1 Tax=Arachis ipaensis TaxID=130454 RepID=UPI000A2AFA9A|nr:uncharacterized protein LOC107610688 [Arachis ipaensis]XP_025669989.1 uncharacterized protein LOC112769729 [Arachis hypogaea]